MLAVTSLHGSKTILIVAHRLSTVEHCDQTNQTNQINQMNQDQTKSTLHATNAGANELMKVRLHPHAVERLRERGTTEEEVKSAVEHGERFAAKHGRTGFRRNFPYGGTWNDKMYATKQVEAYAVEEDGWLVLTVIVKFF